MFCAGILRTTTNSEQLELNYAKFTRHLRKIKDNKIIVPQKVLKYEYTELKLLKRLTFFAKSKSVVHFFLCPDHLD